MKLRRNCGAGADRALDATTLSPSHAGPARLIFARCSQRKRESPVTELSVRQRQGRLSSDAVAALNSDLAARFGNRFTASEAIRQAHGHTLTWLKNEPPDAVVFAESKEDVIDLVKLCARHDAPVVPFGVGSSLEGHVNATHGGVSLDLSRMNTVLAVNADDLDCVVEPGVTRKQIDQTCATAASSFPSIRAPTPLSAAWPRPAPRALNAVRYGTMKDLVLSLGVVVADGSFLRTGTRAKKSSAGYDLTHLFIGAEGTLGIIVEIVLEAVRHPRGHRRRALSASQHTRGVRDDDRDHPVGPADRPHRAHRHAVGARLQ